MKEADKLRLRGRPRNATMSEEEWEFFILQVEAGDLTAADAAELERSVEVNPRDLGKHFQLLSYYHKREFRDKNFKSKLAEHLNWFIDNAPTHNKLVSHTLATIATQLTPKQYQSMREKWLHQVASNDGNGKLLGTAGHALIWRDFETGRPLIEEAHRADPQGNWLSFLIIHAHAQFCSSLKLYKKQSAELVLDIGLRDLTSNFAMRPMTCERLADAALYLNRYDIVRRCATELVKEKMPLAAESYLGLVALREGDVDEAVQRLLNLPNKTPHYSVIQLAEELWHAGKRDAIVEFINKYPQRFKKSERQRWMASIAKGRVPDFRDWAC